MEIARTTLKEVRAANLKPEKHTVMFVNEGDWYCVRDGGKIVAVCCMLKRHYGLCLASLYTLPEYRGRGLMTQLVRYVCDTAYAGKKIYAHCLAASKNIIGRMDGFRFVKHVPYKLQPQWRFIRDGEPE